MDDMKYNNPLVSRYASKEMSYCFSDDHKYKLWRTLWAILAESEKEAGLDNINDEQIRDLWEHVHDDINYNEVAAIESKLQHDVMAHIHAFGNVATKAKPIIHLGATGMYVVDNADMIMMKEALEIVIDKLLKVIHKLDEFSMKYRNLPTLGYTHFQRAQLTTVGKRASLWLYDLFLDYQQIYSILHSLKPRGAKGAVGTQASFLKLFNNNPEKVKELDQLVVTKMGFEEPIPICGQSYTRKIDYQVLSALSGIAQSLHKMTNDIRLLQGLGELEEPFSNEQVGSTAMAYKRNPILCERIASLSRFIISNEANMANTAATQWLERTLDDSAIKRIAIPQGFLAVDAILILADKVISGLQVNENIIYNRVMQELPFIATENILMSSVEHGSDRQQVHEEIRKLSMEVINNIRNGGENNLLQRFNDNPRIGLSTEDINKLIDPTLYTGMAALQVEEFHNYLQNTINLNK